jgi:hypothetical protein
MLKKECIRRGIPMVDQSKMSYIVNLDFETIKLPPVTDILVLGKKVPQGKQGILHSFDLILPDTFELHEINDPAFPNVDAVIINKMIIAKMPIKETIDILTENVFPYVSRGETIKVNISIHIYQRDISGEIQNENP